MTYEFCIHTTGSIETLLKREDDHHAVDSLLYPAQAAALPRPELRADKVNDRDTYFFQFASEAEIDVGEVNEDGDVRAALSDGRDQATVRAIDTRSMADDFGDAHVGYILSPDHAVETDSLHLAAAEPKENCSGVTFAKLGNELCAVVVAARLAGREKDLRIGWVSDATSVDFLQGIYGTKCGKKIPRDVRTSAGRARLGGGAGSV